jgi:hypothetical protein
MRITFTAAGPIIAAIAVFGSALATDVPAAPSQLTWGSTGISWKDNSDNEDGFRLEKLVWGEWLFVAEYPANTTSAQGVPLGHDPGCLLPLRLIAFNDTGDSQPSDAATYIPTPTPPPSGCPFTVTATYTNDTTSRSGKLILPEIRGWTSLFLSANAPGCAAPIIARVASQYELEWPSACVDPGESVAVTINGIGPSDAPIHKTWIQETATATPTSTAVTPIVTPASLPTTGRSQVGAATNLLLLALSASGLLSVATLAFKRIR